MVSPCEAIWPMEMLDLALPSLAEDCSIATGHHGDLGSPQSSDVLSEWLDRCAGVLGVEIEPVKVEYGRVKEALAAASPALFELHVGDRSGYILIAHAGDKYVWLLSPELKRMKFAIDEVADLLTSELAASKRDQLDKILGAGAFAASTRARLKSALESEVFGDSPLRTAWIVRAAASSAISNAFRVERVWMRVAFLALAYLCQYAMFLGSWWLIGRASLVGFQSQSWLLLLALLLLGMIPLRMFVTRAQGVIATDVGAILKRKILDSATRAEFSESRREGFGKLVARALDSERIESAALEGGFLTLLSIIELLLACVVLGFGINASAMLAALAVVATIVLALGAQQLSLRERWTERRLGLTDSLIERVQGHRTRLVQEPMSQWHDAEDRELRDYLMASERMDRSMIRLEALVPRAWLVLGLLVLSPSLVAHTDLVPVAISLGGLLLGYRVLLNLVAGFDSLSMAWISWKKVRSSLIDDREDVAEVPPGKSVREEGDLLLKAIDVSVSHANSQKQPFEIGSFSIHRNDKILLEGPSGSGKSTFGKLLAGLHAPESGTVLLDGRDIKALGSAEWRRRVTSAPQFHENHIFSESFLFNLLLGDSWPPSEEKWLEAHELCEALGLGDLLNRMPGGMTQMVGETGWQLSHGERSRVFIARALLRGADLLVLDESFAALDPASLRQSLECVMQRSRGLVLIAHS